MSSRARMWMAVAAKVTVTVALLAWLLSTIDWSELVARMTGISPGPLLLAVFLLFIIIVPVARRWHLIVLALEGHISFAQAFRMVLMTVLLNQSVPSNLGGDAYRIVATSRTGMPWKRATLAAIVDRLIALLALAIVALFGVLSLLNLAGLEYHRYIAIAGTGAIICGAMLAWLFFRSNLAEKLAEKVELFGRLRSALAALLDDPAEAAYLLLLSIVVQFVTIAAMSLVAIDTGVAVPLLPMLAVCALGLLIARLPVSYGGWGVREGTLVLGFAPFGVTREAALAASITYGLTELAAAVIGGLVWVALSVASDTRLGSKGQAS